MKKLILDRSRFPIAMTALGVMAAIAFSLTATVQADDLDVKKKLQGVDLTGVKKLRLSPDGELVAGLTKLYSNPDSRSGSFSLFKIWSVKEQKLLHQIRVPAEAYEVVFSPGSSTVVTAEKKGNLGYGTTVRAWNRAAGEERKIGSVYRAERQETGDTTRRARSRTPKM